MKGTLTEIVESDVRHVVLIHSLIDCQRVFHTGKASQYRQNGRLQRPAAARLDCLDLLVPIISIHFDTPNSLKAEEELALEEEEASVLSLNHCSEDFRSHLGRM